MIVSRRRRLFWLGPAVVLFSLGLATLVRYQGILLPVRIASGSMAEQLLGPHRLVLCAECGFAFRCGLDVEAPLQQVTCPNCGFQRNDLSLAAFHEGDRVLIDRWAYIQAVPERGDVVAFVDPMNDTELAVKRVIGLPKEVVSIRRGELFINGLLYRKSLQETMELATLVYDDAFRLSDGQHLPPRWMSEDDESGWQATNNGYHWAGKQAPARANDWLMYRHWRCYTSPNPRTEESPVTDNDAYNQGLSRALHEVTDLLLSCDLALSKDGEVVLLIHDGRESFTVAVSAASRSLHVRRGEEFIARATIPNDQEFHPLTIQFGVIDEQLLVAIANAAVIRHAYTPLDRPLQPTSRPLGIAGRVGACSIANLRVYRDIYYLNAFQGDWPWFGPDPLEDDCYLVLGDNTPLSNDSRHWAKPGLQRKRFVGKVLMPCR
ncbi:MAG: signal peptidase I [Planctomycetia bacterium]|nr:signal peptidase I [Planctomycetia bacterium]